MALRSRTQRAQRTQETPAELISAEPPAVGDIEIEIDPEDLGDAEVSITAPPVEREPEIRPAPRTSEPETNDAVAQALQAQRRAEQMQAEAMRQRDEAIRRAQAREGELARERTDRQDAEYNSILTAIAAEQSTLEKAEADYAAAASVGDWATAAKAQTVQSRASSRLDRLEDGKRSFDSRREDQQQQRQPEPQRQPQGDPIEMQIAAIQMPEDGKTWLRTHRDYLTDPRKNAALQKAHYDALDVAPIGTPKYIEAIELALGMRQAQQAEPVQQQRRSMPMTAPVSREAPTASGTRQKTSMRLTEEERQIARASIVDRPDMPKLTNAQKEYLYAKNKAKYQEMRANGTYTDQRRS